MEENKIKSYRNCLILAPMVRVSTLPMRLLAIEMGADIVYSEELVDFKILNCIRLKNDRCDTIDFVSQVDNTIVFRTCSKEQNKVIAQIASNSPERALAAAKLLEKDVAGIDLNMGCPKKFSIKGGMGAALLTNPEKARSILITLIRYCKKPISCKIRILENFDDTLQICKIIESCGISALAIHGRTQQERSSQPNHNKIISEIKKYLSVPLIGSGFSNEIKVFHDIERIWKETGVDSVMLARAAMHNPSVFCRKGFFPSEYIIRRYLQLSTMYENCIANVKYCLQSMLAGTKHNINDLWKKAQSLQNLW